MRPGWLAALAPVLAGAAAVSPPAPPAALPFVGCASDGQAGPARAPRARRAPMTLHGPSFAAYAYYSMGEIGVFGPRGWHCFGLSGSNGAILLVTPEPLGADGLGRRSGIPGPAIQLTYRYGGTSGRFEVARAIARLFPGQMGFVRRVAAEGIETDFPSGPYPDDYLYRASPTEVIFETASGRTGLGTENRLAREPEPVGGIVILREVEGEGDFDLVKLDMRMPGELSQRRSWIVEGVRADARTGWR